MIQSGRLTERRSERGGKERQWADRDALRQRGRGSKREGGRR